MYPPSLVVVIISVGFPHSYRFYSSKSRTKLTTFLSPNRFFSSKSSSNFTTFPAIGSELFLLLIVSLAQNLVMNMALGIYSSAQNIANRFCQ